MNRSNQPWAPAAAAEIDWSESGVPRSTRFDDVYFSVEDGTGESEYVFLAGNGLPARWSHTRQSEFAIVETGFGTGLNLLLTWQAWKRHPAPPPLHYLAIEKHPLRPADLRRALAQWPSLAPLAEQLLAHYPGLQPGQHRLLLENGRLVIDLWWEDVSEALQDLAELGPRVDAWYLDGFAPARNEAMWQQPLFQAMAAMSRPEASFGTFTAAGHVRRGLQAAGFEVQKVPGFGRKRECLRGHLAHRPAHPAPRQTPWDLDRVAAAAPRTALVLGAGLAGAHCAEALARRGVAVTVLDRHDVAGAASGNSQGILFTRLSHRHSPLADFALQAFAFAARRYRDLIEQGRLRRGEDADLCGYLQQDIRERDLERFRERLRDTPELAQVLDQSGAAAQLGPAVSGGGLWFGGSGWINPPALCRTLLDHPAITLRSRCDTLQLSHRDGLWHAHRNGEIVASAEVAIVAAGTQSVSFEGLQGLPLQAIRGQTTQLPGGPWSELAAALCHEGYIPPARHGEHCIGATFDLRDPDTSVRPADHRRNLDALAQAVPPWADALAELDERRLQGRTGFRCASPDYLPLVGPAPDRERFLQRFEALRRNARQVLPETGCYLPGLYVSTGHGSRGLTYTPLSAELLASRICGELPPLGRELQRALSPARFLIRDLARNKA